MFRKCPSTGPKCTFKNSYKKKLLRYNIVIWHNDQNDYEEYFDQKFFKSENFLTPPRYNLREGFRWIFRLFQRIQSFFELEPSNLVHLFIIWYRIYKKIKNSKKPPWPLTSLPKSSFLGRFGWNLKHMLSEWY